MYITCTNNNGTPYLKVVEDYSATEGGIWKRKKRVLKNIGPLARFDDGDPDYLKRLRSSFKAGDPIIEDLRELLEDAVASRLDLSFDLTSDTDCYSDPKNIGYFVLDALFGELGIMQVLCQHRSRNQLAYDLAGIARLLVFGRVLDPASKRATFASKDSYLFDIASSDGLNDVYRVLDDLDVRSRSIQKRMDTKIKAAIGRDSGICYYDVTNYFFEIDGADSDTLDDAGNVLAEGMRKPGPSKVKNRKPIVEMGLFTDACAIPISYHLFPGNHIDQTTLRPTMRSTIEKMGYGRVVIVADGGINSGKNIAHILDSGNGYIVAKSAKGSDKDVKGWILDQAGYVSNTSGTFKCKSKVRKRTVTAEDGTKRQITEKIVSFWSYSHYLRALKENESFLTWVENVTKHPDKLKDKQSNYQKYLKKTIVDKKTGEVLGDAIAVLSLALDKIKQDQTLMGYYTIITSEVDLDDRAIIDRYHGLARIEDAFRTLKTDLEGRPVYVRTPEHINAHFLICFIALTMIRILQYRLLRHLDKSPDTTSHWEHGLTAERIKAALAGFCADPLPQGYFRISKPTDDLNLLMDALGQSADLRLPSAGDLHQFKYGINKTKIM